MTSAFVDTSILLALEFQEADFERAKAQLERFDVLYASDLLEAELHSACAREQRNVDPRLTQQLRVVYPPRSIRPEIVRTLNAGYLRGAECFHLAVALSIAPNPRELTFLTRDNRQRTVAAALGFAV